MRYEQFTYDGSLQENAMELREHLELELTEMSERTGASVLTLMMFENGDELTTSPMLEAAYYNQMVLSDLQISITHFLKDALTTNPNLLAFADKYELSKYIDEEVLESQEIGIAQMKNLRKVDSHLKRLQQS